MATKDQTTARVVAIPTPFAPPLALYPNVQLINEIKNPYVIAFKILTLISYIYIPYQTESK